MKTKIIMCVFLGVLIGFMAGCTWYSAKGAIPMMDRVEENKLVKMEKEGVAITAFPILNEDDSSKYFDRNIIPGRMFAVYLSIFNKTSNEVRVISSEFRIGKTILQPSTAEEMYKVIKREYGVKAFIWMFPTYFVGAPISIAHTHYVNKKIEADMEKKQMEFHKEIKPSGILQGFIWFKVPKKVAPEYESEGLPKGTVFNLILEQEKRVVEFGLPVS
jgi:hypothetical protein